MPQHSMQPQYPVSQSLTLPPLQHHHPQSPAPHHYMGQTYQPDLSRFPASTQDMYPASTVPAMPQRTACSLQLPPLLSVPNPQAQVHSRYHPALGGLALASTAQSHPQPIARHLRATVALASTVFPPVPSATPMAKFAIWLRICMVRTALVTPRDRYRRKLWDFRAALASGRTSQAARLLPKVWMRNSLSALQ
jgi:hypothetical protein